MKVIERELELATRAMLAAEDWAPGYERAPEEHATLIRLMAKMNLLVLRYFRQLAKQAPGMINWYHYSAAVYEQQRALSASSVQAYDVNVVINNDAVSQEDQVFIKLIFDTIATAAATGVASMEVERGVPISLSSTSSIIQSLTTEQLANLVGMKVQKDGKIVPNPNKAYNIDETTRSKIARSVQTSIQLGEKQEQAVKRLQTVIADSKRADMIAYTETVRAYATGRATYAKESGAYFKQWFDRNAVDVCADNAAEGPIPIDANFIGGFPSEPQHPRCLCLTSYIYDREVEGPNGLLRIE